MSTIRLEKALKRLTEVDDCSLSWDRASGIVEAVAAIDEYVEEKIRAALNVRNGSDTPEKIQSARENNNQ